MKTKEVIQEELFAQQGLRITLTGIEAIQRDAWQSATKAQRMQDIEDERDATSSGYQPRFTPAPFPGDPT